MWKMKSTSYLVRIQKFLMLAWFPFWACVILTTYNHIWSENTNGDINQYLPICRTGCLCNTIRIRVQNPVQSEKTYPMCTRWEVP